ncbi:PAS domain-containing sensor histidine kinase [Tellurirhabdus rosea]|uniref:PAS domain-containing sensor histidine kinase n=1 Tax=Tellurirhabdus rosea TaxID=2674997 RepID=UPI0022579557|nr:PAS domain-containing protein [Tellurirhabdus rosea]
MTGKPGLDSYSRELLQCVLQGSLSCVVVLEALYDNNLEVADFQIVMANQAALDMARMPSDRIIGTRMSVLFPGMIQGDVFQRMKTTLQTGRPDYFEWQHTYYYQKRVGWFETSTTAFQQFVIVTFVDVTEKKSRELLLTEVLNTSLTGIFAARAVRGADGTLTDFELTLANEALGGLMGTRGEGLVGLSLLSIFPTIREFNTWKYYVLALETGQPQRFEQYCPYEGGEAWFDVSLRTWGDGVVANFIDISAAKQAGLRIQQTADLLRSVLDGSQSAIIGFDAVRDESGQVVNFRYIVQNAVNRQRIGRSDEELIGHTMLEFFPSVKEYGLFERYVRVVDTGVPERFELKYNHDRLNGWYDVTVVKRNDGIVLTLLDKTESHRAEEQREALLEELRRSNENLEQFAYIASHDLQEPLRKIQSFAEVLTHEFAPELSFQAADMITRMQRSADRMQTLIRDLLTFSRLATQKEPFRPVNLNTLLQDVLIDLETAIQDKNAEILLLSLPEVKGDALQVRLLFQNLLSNALKFSRTDVRPQITVTARVVPAIETEITTLQNLKETYHAITVADNGIGFNEKYRERIFLAFHRLHNRSQYPGTGIGLAIVRKVVDNHRGSITVRSEIGVGSAFTVYLPVK